LPRQLEAGTGLLDHQAGNARRAERQQADDEGEDKTPHIAIVARSVAGAPSERAVTPQTGAGLKVGDIRQIEPTIHAGVEYIRTLVSVRRSIRYAG
jgi:hypothetical protein